MVMRYLGGGPYHTILRGIINVKDTLRKIFGSSKLAAEEDEDDSDVDDEASEAEDSADDWNMSEREFDLGPADGQFGWDEEEEGENEDNDSGEDEDEEGDSGEDEEGGGDEEDSAEEDGWVVGRLSGYYH